MKLKFKNNIIPILGWCERASCHHYKELASECSKGLELLCDSDLDLIDDEICAFIFYDEYIVQVYQVFIGRAKFLGHRANHYVPYVYVFSPERKVKIGHIRENNFEEPEAAILKPKKL